MGIYHSSEHKAIPKIVNKATGKVTVDPHIKWEWQSNSQPWNSDQVQEWTSYIQENIEILERAFREKQTKAEIGDYIADFETFCQYHKIDHWRIRPLRRVDLKRRVWRFCSELSTFKTFNQAPYSENPPLVEKWLNNRVFNFKMDSKGYNITDEENQKVLQEIAHLALIGISKEAEKNNCKDSFKPILDRLEPIVTKNSKMIFRGFILAYTMETIKEGESFYSLVNRALRDDDFSKAETLGPFCYLLNLALKSLSYSSESECSYNGTVYRGLTIEEGLLDYYKKALKRGLHISLQPFISTTKSKDLANLYLSKEEWERKVLLLIEDAKGTSAEIFTAHEYEQEVILPAGSSYEIVEIKEEELITIRLKMIDTRLLKKSDEENTEPIALACNSMNNLLDYFDNLEQMKKPSFNVDEGGLNLTPQSKVKDLEEYVGSVTEGIESMPLESDEEKVKAKGSAQELRNIMKDAPESVFKLILKQLVIDESLRNQVNVWMQKGKNDERKELEPFIYLLLSYFRALKQEVKENAEPKANITYAHIYRNVDLSSGDIELYQEVFAKKLHFVYNAFLPALKKKEAAKKVLIDIEIPEEMLPGFEVSGVHGSVYKEQVLLPPGLNFEILNIEVENGGLVKISLRFVDYELLAKDKL